jgi:hypothetical protein
VMWVHLQHDMFMWNFHEICLKSQALPLLDELPSTRCIWCCAMELLLGLCQVARSPVFLHRCHHYQVLIEASMMPLCITLQAKHTDTCLKCWICWFQPLAHSSLCLIPGTMFALVCVVLYKSIPVPCGHMWTRPSLGHNCN